MSGRVIIGLTGNIATGKSAIMRLAAERGALTIDADRVVHELLDGDAAIQTAVADAFGPGVRRADGRIDRAALGAIVYGDAEQLGRLEALLHPVVRAEIGRRVAATDAPVVMIEAIKLLEGPLAAVCRQVWVTTCARETQLERLRVCRGLDEATAVARVEAQSLQADKIARADVVIATDGLMTQTQAQFETAWGELQMTSDE
ncbi:MAG: dephospho-CoA kinase [Anaerolineae bacterium]|uniref:dephospho-CoA kinase n=1 Tax=Promineifilum sp. TaxID=2664178 RepID=UPI001DCB7321|nr:dephospho-CoA kinase [Anaerolineales bacterium]MCO5180617.1 dephospho-CoA kinase [Promineifilum sp.]MCW5847656.1 dephospho-CoA kinase [Anaerolineae bacterium]